MSFNASIPSINGTISNYNSASADTELARYLSREYVTDAPLTNVIRGCLGSCTAKLKAPALSAVCETHHIPVNYTAAYPLADYDKVWNQQSAPPLNQQAFMISISLDERTVETLNLVTGWSETNECVGNFTYTVCTLASAIGEYDVSINGNKATLINPSQPRIIAVANNTKADHSWDRFSAAYSSTLAAQAELFFTQFESFMALFTVQGSMQHVLIGSGISAAYQTTADSTCPSFSDPHERVVAALNQMMVYTGVKAASENTTYLDAAMDSGWPVNTTTVGAIVGNRNVYKSEFRFFIAAAVIEFVCIILVAPTYWGWWRLGRPCSFSPLEVAKVSFSPSFLPCPLMASSKLEITRTNALQAFDSSLLADVNSNSSGRDLARNIGDIYVRYGSAQCGTPARSKLVFGDPAVLEQPEKGAKFDV